MRKLEDLTPREYFVAAALSHCDGKADEWQLKKWFGNAGGVTKAMIIARQAGEIADALLMEGIRK